MSDSSGLWFRLRALFSRRQMERELAEEMSFHLEQEAGKHRAAGLDPSAAEREARKSFGRIVHHKDAARTAWGVQRLDELRGDVRFALRQMFAHKTFSSVAILTLALGVGGTVALFAAVYGLLLRPLPFDEAQELRVFWDDYSWSAAELEFARENTTAYRGLGAFTVDSQTLRQNDSTRVSTSMVSVGLVSGDALDLLGTSPLLGRALNREEERLGSPPVVVLGYDFWQTELGGREGIVGERLELDGAPTTVVGVMPAGFYLPTPEADVWRPLTVDAADPDYGENHWLTVFGRIGNGVSEAAVQNDLERFAILLGENFEYPEAWDKTKGYFIETMRQYLIGDSRPALLLLLGSVALLLLMASANVAALLVARISDRDSEIALRKALGAGRARLSRQLLTESLVLGVIASALGLLIAVAGYRALVAQLPLPAGFDQTLALTWPLVATTFVLTPVITALVALAPLRRLWAFSRLASRRGLGPARGQLQQGLVVGEIVVAVVLVSCAMLLARSVLELYRIDSGLEPDHVAAIDLFAADAELDSEQRRAFYQELIEAAVAAPGIELAAIINRLPIRDHGVQGPLLAEGRPDLEGARRPNAKWRYVSPDFHRTLGIDLVEGRPFDASDRADSKQVGILGIDFAKRLWPGESAIGKRVKVRFQYEDWIEIVGVTEAVTYDRVQDGPSSVLYRPLAQVSPWQSAVLVVRSSVDSKTALATIRSLSGELDSRVALAGAITMNDVMRRDLAEPLQLRFFLGLFSVMALVIGAVGVYGVISYAVSRRTAEYGLRMALGAKRRDLLRSVIAGGMRLVAVGVVGGLIAALASSVLLSGFLYGVEPRDPASYLLAAALLVMVGLFACIAPAYRASR